MRGGKTSGNRPEVSPSESHERNPGGGPKGLVECIRDGQGTADGVGGEGVKRVHEIMAIKVRVSHGGLGRI